nr:hypothetical protein [Lysinibacillus timonensis]
MIECFGYVIVYRNYPIDYRIHDQKGYLCDLDGTLCDRMASLGARNKILSDRFIGMN